MVEVDEIHAVLRSKGSADILLHDESILKQNMEQTGTIHLGTRLFDLRLGQQAEISEDFNSVFVILGHLSEKGGASF